ncbi:MAG TPA: S8 family serine peptidase [Longimicrobiaceae bacterium]|nr:S8 family serine peptidase [Longimicrobiaceae bacterium]
MADPTPPRRARRSDDPTWFTGDVIVCLRDDYERRPGLARAGEALAVLTGFLRERGVPEPEPLIGSIPPEAIDELERVALDSRLQPLRSLNSYWRIDARSQGAPEFVDALSRLPGVETAYRERRTRDPSSTPVPNPFGPRQKYLDGQGVGIDARSMWALTRGEGVAVADIERAWNLDHEEVSPKLPRLVYGTNLRDVLRDQGDHGTAVLSIVAAADNQVGIVGVAPDVDEVVIASRFDCVRRSETQVAAAIAAATWELSPGDVLLVEVEIEPGLPMELQQAEFDAIRLASAAGRVVVEAAGNGKEDLDTHAVLDRTAREFRESGAIMVGAAAPFLPHNRFKSSFGSRIDCYAHGANVTAAGFGDLSPGARVDAHYTRIFGGTSAAAAIIAGAAILVQARHKAKNGTVLSPLDLRDILAQPSTGTRQGPKPGNIGVMPDLSRIVAAHPSLQ